jgi:hypothetical protein
MRKVEIIEERVGLRRWKAVDQASRQPLLSLRDQDQLCNICERLEWRIVAIRRSQQV